MPIAKESGRIAKGYLTVYMTLILAVLLSLCLTLIEGARSNAIEVESEIVSDIAVNSIMAEFNRELMAQYNIFAIEDSYGTNSASLSNTEAHLDKYLDKNFSTEDVFLSSFLYRDFMGITVDTAQIEGVLYMTDDAGAVFRRRAYEALKDDVGVTLLSELMDWVNVIESNALNTTDVTSELIGTQQQLLEAQGEAGAVSSEGEIAGEEGNGEDSDEDADEDSDEESIAEESTTEITEIVISGESTAVSSLNTNPAANVIRDLSDSYYLGNFMDDTSQISAKQMDISQLVLSRKQSGMINSGNLTLEEESNLDQIIERFVFQEYLLRYMGRYQKEADNDALKYQIEYLIGGHDSDRQNLIIVCSYIFSIRFAADYMYILTDQEKCDEAETVGTILAILTFMEEFKDLYKHLILLFWAYSEAKYDVGCLLAGNKIELLKNEDNWHINMFYCLAETVPDRDGDENGLTYVDYLRVFMMLMNQDLLSFRAMDMVEADIRLTPGNEFFRMDACIDTIQTKIRTASRFGYSYEYVIRRKYE